MTMNKSILYFLLGVVSTLVVEGIAIFIMLYDPSPGHIEVSENDWNDDWEKDVNLKDSSVMEFYNYRTGTSKYIIHNFVNNPGMVKFIKYSIDTSSFFENNHQIVWMFLWNDRYNHKWRVEEVNQEYINNVSTLFRVVFVRSTEKNLFIKDLNLFPSLSKKHTLPITIEPINKRNNTIYLRTDYKNGFDFFLWKDLQDYTKSLSEKSNHKGRYTLLEGSGGKELATIEWFGEGYKLRLPKDENRSRK